MFCEDGGRDGQLPGPCDGGWKREFQTDHIRDTKGSTRTYIIEHMFGPVKGKFVIKDIARNEGKYEPCPG